MRLRAVVHRYRELLRAELLLMKCDKIINAKLRREKDYEETRSTLHLHMAHACVRAVAISVYSV